MSFCDIYPASSTTWPLQQFPRTYFPRWTGQRLTEAKRAWEYYEKVEAYDAAVRVAICANPNSPDPIWFPIRNEGDRILYTYGKSLHTLLCPLLNWKPQRNQSLTYSPTPINVVPQICGVAGTLTGTGPCP